MDSKKKNNTWVWVAGIAALTFYVFNRSNINIIEVDQATGDVDYKINLGFKTVEGTVNINNAKGQVHEFFNRSLQITVIDGSILDFSIIKKDGTVIDNIQVEFNPKQLISNVWTQIEPTGPTKSETTTIATAKCSQSDFCNV